MTAARLPAHLEASSLLRRAEAAGGFGAILGRGDRDSGSLLLLIASRGVHVACLERQLSQGNYQWVRIGPGANGEASEVSEWVQKRRRFDPDCWAIELDIPLAERFIAETISAG